MLDVNEMVCRLEGGRGGGEGRTLRHDAPLEDLAHLHYLKLANYNRVSGSLVSLLSEMNCS